MANSQDKAKEHQLANSYSSQKGEPERHLLNPLYHQNHQPFAGGSGDIRDLAAAVQAHPFDWSMSLRVVVLLLCLES